MVGKSVRIISSFTSHAPIGSLALYTYCLLAYPVYKRASKTFLNLLFHFIKFSFLRHQDIRHHPYGYLPPNHHQPLIQGVSVVNPMMLPPQANTANTATANFTDDSTPAAFVNFGTPPQFNPTAPSQPIASWMNSSVSVVNSAERDNNTGFGRFDDSSMRRPVQSQRQYSNEMPGNHWEAGRGGQLANGGGGGRDGNFNTGNNLKTI